MAIRILKETGASRSAGYKVTANVSILPGNAVVLGADEETIKLPASGTSEEILGLALDSNVMFPFQSATPDQTMGNGYDYLNYNRQGLVSVFNNGGEVELFDDKRLADGLSHPVIYGGTFTLNIPVYANCTSGTSTQLGFITEVATTNKRIGRVTGVFGTGADLVLRIIVEI